NIYINLCFLVIDPSLFAQKSFTLNEAIQYAEKNSKALQIQKLDINDAEDVLTEYKSIGMPKLTGGINYSYFIDIPTNILPDFISPSVYEVLFDENILPRKDLTFGSGIPAQFGTKNNLTAKLELSTLIFDGSFFVGLKAQKLYRELITKQLVQSTAEVRYQVTKAYMATIAVNNNIEILDKNINNLTKVYNEMNQIYKAGLTEKLDVERLELSLLNLNSEKEKLNRLYEITKQLLKYQMSFPLSENIELTQSFDELMLSSAINVTDPSFNLNFQNRPEYDVINQGIQLAEINIKRFKVSYLPSIFGFATAQESLQRNNLFDGDENKWFPTTIVGVGMNVPIFDGFERKSKISKAKTLLNRSQMQKSEFERGVTLAYENAKIQYANAANTLETKKKTLSLAEKIYQTSQTKFKSGVGSSLEISTSERDVYSAQANLLEAQLNLIYAKIDLDKALGKI
ncbi:MAG: TolC family protein, partial [Saprospiraceae bacterium]|nr:TolC family protein [Saprospiraceae bacterium]